MKTVVSVGENCKEIGRGLVVVNIEFRKEDNVGVEFAGAESNGSGFGGRETVNI